MYTSDQENNLNYSKIPEFKIMDNLRRFSRIIMQIINSNKLCYIAPSHANSI